VVDGLCVVFLALHLTCLETFFSTVRNTGCNCGSSTAFHVAYGNCPLLWLLFVSAYEVLLVKVAVCASIASIP